MFSGTLWHECQSFLVTGGVEGSWEHSTPYSPCLLQPGSFVWKESAFFLSDNFLIFLQMTGQLTCPYCYEPFSMGRRAQFLTHTQSSRQHWLYCILGPWAFLNSSFSNMVTMVLKFMVLMHKVWEPTTTVPKTLLYCPYILISPLFVSASPIC